MTDSVQPNPSRPTVTDEAVLRFGLEVGVNVHPGTPRFEEFRTALANHTRRAVAAPAPDRDAKASGPLHTARNGAITVEVQEPDWDSEDECEFRIKIVHPYSASRSTEFMLHGDHAIGLMEAANLLAEVLSELAGVGGVLAEPQTADHAIDVHRVPGPGLHPDYYAACICGWSGTNRIASDLAQSEGTEHLAGAVPQDRKADR